MAKSTASLEALIAKFCSCSVKAKSPFCIEVPDNANSPFNRNKPALCSGANSTVCSPCERSKRRARTGVSIGYRAARTDEGRDFKAVFLCDGKVVVAIVVVGRRFSQTLLQVQVEPDLEKSPSGFSFSAWVMPLPERMICTSPALSGSHCRLLLS